MRVINCTKATYDENNYLFNCVPVAFIHDEIIFALMRITKPCLAGFIRVFM